MKEIIYSCFAKYLSGYLNFHDTDEKWDQPQQQTKKSTYLWKLVVISLEKARWKYLKQCPKFIVTLQDNKEHTSNEANIIGTIMQWSNIGVAEALHYIIYECNEATTVLLRLYMILFTSAMKQRHFCRGFI